MDYEKKYNYVLKRAEALKKCCLSPKIKDWVDNVFPELRESEDEKTRKEIIYAISRDWLRNGNNIGESKTTKKEALAWLIKQGENSPFNKESDERIRKALICGMKAIKINPKMQTFAAIPIDDCIAWLEKQGQKPQNKTSFETTKEENVDNANKVEPKFKVGDWIVWQNKCYKVNYNGCGYKLIDQNGLSTSLEYGTVDENAHLWTINDAKDGDVLVDVYENTGIFQKNDDFDWTSYCSLGINGGFQNFKVEHENDKTHPATKEQRDLLFQKMKEACHEWDAEKKELKTIERKITESESKSIRKDIIRCLKHSGIKPDKPINPNVKTTVKDALAWLEKQGDINDTINRDKFTQYVLRSAAINLITWIDYNAAEGNACLSNTECKDIEDALVSGDWDKIYGYMKKKLEK